jgi:hypothetical protein
MDDAGRMRVGDRVGHLNRQVERATRIQRPPGDRRGQRLARHVLEHEVQLAVLVADFVQRRNVRVRERSGCARFLQESLAAFAVAGDRGRQHLDRDGATQPGIARAVHLAHPACADPVEDSVLPERLEHRTRRLY